MKRFTTYTDESGIVNKRKFIVVTIIVQNKNCETFVELLKKIEKNSGKNKKWTDVSNLRRSKYAELLLKENIFSLCTVYFQVFISKSDYVSLVSSQIAKSITNYANREDYKATIFLDQVNNKTTYLLKRSLHSWKIRYKKIRGLDDTNNVGLKLADSICGLIRDIGHEGIDDSYRQIYKKLNEM